MPASASLVDPALAREKAAQYRRDGFCLAPAVMPAELLARVIPRMDAVRGGEYETGRPPLNSWARPGDAPGKLSKVDQAHVADRTIHETITHPALGAWVAALTGAQRVQVWAVQMLHKPPGGDALGAVGWHQDLYYWNTWWQPGSEVFTAWLAISDVREESGPMHFVAGSHHWGLREGSDFFGAADESKRKIALPPKAEWNEVSGAMPAGAFSLHHCLTFHGSQPNVSPVPRRSFAIHLCTEKATPIPDRKIDTKGGGYDYLEHLTDPAICPVIHGG
jgi:ectoine hydroxylase-related dioxygenase (phytanoyl-CoA dioxygenase family)